MRPLLPPGDEKFESASTPAWPQSKLCAKLRVWQHWHECCIIQFLQAGMAKLADAADLKSAGLKRPVGVRFPLPAP